MRSIVLALALSLLAVPARAQSDGAPREYQALIDAAVAEFSAGRWPEARAMFQRAHASFPNARTLRGIGMSSFEMRDYPEAARALEAALASPIRPLTEEQRAQVSALLVRAQALVGRFRVPAAPAGSHLYVDGAGASAGEGWPAGEGTLVLAVGPHEVAIRADGRSAQAHIDVRGGEDTTLDIDLAPLQPPQASSGTTTARVVGGGDLDQPPPRTRTTRTPARPADDDTGAWVVLGGGLGIAAIGGVLFGIGAADVAAVESSRVWPDVRDRADRAPILTGAGGTLLGVGLGAAVIGLIWALTNDPGQEAERVAGVRIDLGVGALTLEGSF